MKINYLIILCACAVLTHCSNDVESFNKGVEHIQMSQKVMDFNFNFEQFNESIKSRGLDQAGNWEMKLNLKKSKVTFKAYDLEHRNASEENYFEQSPAFGFNETLRCELTQQISNEDMAKLAENLFKTQYKKVTDCGVSLRFTSPRWILTENELNIGDVSLYPSCRKGDHALLASKAQCSLHKSLREITNQLRRDCGLESVDRLNYFQLCSGR